MIELPGSSAVNNFVRHGPVSDVVSLWRRLESDCQFRLFSNSCKLKQSTSKYLSNFVSGGPWPLRSHSGCATATCKTDSLLFHSKLV